MNLFIYIAVVLFTGFISKHHVSSDYYYLLGAVFSFVAFAIPSIWVAYISFSATKSAISCTTKQAESFGTILAYIRLYMFNKGISDEKLNETLKETNEMLDEKVKESKEIISKLQREVAGSK